MGKKIRKAIFYCYLGCIAPSIRCMEVMGLNPWPGIIRDYRLFVEQGVRLWK